eukprot:312915_1
MSTKQRSNNDTSKQTDHLSHYSEFYRSAAFKYYCTYIIIIFIVFIIYLSSTSKAFTNVFAVIATILPSLLITAFSTSWIHTMANNKSIRLSIALSIMICSLMFIFCIFTVFASAVLNALIDTIIQSDLLTTHLLTPLLEEALKMVTVLIVFGITMVVFNKDNKRSYYYLQTASVAIGAAFGMFENFWYVAFCEWDDFQWHGLECSPEMKEKIKHGERISLIAFGRAALSIPLHSCTPYIMMSFVCVAHFWLVSYQARVKRDRNELCYCCFNVYGLPVLLHVINNSDYLTFMIPIGVIMATWFVQREFESVLYGEDELKESDDQAIPTVMMG